MEQLHKALALVDCRCQNGFVAIEERGFQNNSDRKIMNIIQQLTKDSFSGVCLISLKSVPDFDILYIYILLFSFCLLGGSSRLSSPRIRRFCTRARPRVKKPRGCGRSWCAPAAPAESPVGGVQSGPQTFETVLGFEGEPTAQAFFLGGGGGGEEFALKRDTLVLCLRFCFFLSFLLRVCFVPKNPMRDILSSCLAARCRSFPRKSTKTKRWYWAPCDYLAVGQNRFGSHFGW